MALGKGVREARTTTAPASLVGGGYGAALQLEPVHLSDLVCRVVGRLDGPGRRAHVLLEPVPTVMADRDELALAVAKLLDNALAYSPQAQPVEVEVAGRCLAQESGSLVVLEGASPADVSHALTLGTKPEDEGCRPAVSVALRDLGPGLTPEELERVLLETTGSGLAVARTIVDRHEGRLWARSQPGRGSAFGFCLPAAALGEEAA